MKKNSTIGITILLLAACSRSPQTEKAPPKAGEPEPLRATRWTSQGELFVEFPALVANQRSRFAIHLTRLSDFHAVKNAACEVRLTMNGSTAVFPCDPSSHPGIFGANVEPKGSGEARMSIAAHGKDLNETFDVGPVRIAAGAATADRPAEAKEETISFTKEQQWALDFGTQVAAEQTLRDSLRVPGETLPRTGGEVAVIAPVAGRVLAEKTFAIGTNVEKDVELAVIVPPTGAVSELPGFQLAASEAKIALGQAERDRARAERLVTAGAAPARRLEEARAAESTAQARLQAAQARLAQYEATSSGAGQESGSKRFIVRAPIGGVVTESSAIRGANVELGSVLLRIVDTDTLYIKAAVPEADFPKLRQLSGGEIEMPGSRQVRPSNRLVSIGRLVEEATRTVPVIYEVDNRDHVLAVNQTVYLRLLLTAAARTPAIPEAAIVDDAGRPIVFVQVAGEHFVRRPVKLGVRNAGLVQVLEGVLPGDRVVTKGAYLVRLSTMSSAVPAHGHVH